MRHRTSAPRPDAAYLRGSRGGHGGAGPPPTPGCQPRLRQTRELLKHAFTNHEGAGERGAGALHRPRMYYRTVTLVT